MAKKPSRSSSAPPASGPEKSAPAVSGEVLRTSADEALFGGKLRGLVVTFHQNERPLGGLAGLLDWRFQGAISFHLRSGSLTGKPGEIAYLPMSRHGRVYHLILVGAGASDEPGSRSRISAETFDQLKQRVRTLGLDRLGVSCSDLGNVEESELRERIQGAPLWIVN